MLILLLRLAIFESRAPLYPYVPTLHSLAPAMPIVEVLSMKGKEWEQIHEEPWMGGPVLWTSSNPT